MLIFYTKFIYFFQNMTKTLVCLKVEALKCVKGRCFEIAKRSGSIGVSNSSQK